MDKNVLYIGAFELPDKNAAAHRVLANAKIFIELGYDVYCLGVKKESKVNLHSEYGFIKENDLSGIRCYSYDYNDKLKSILDYAFTAKTVKKFVNKVILQLPDIIVAYNYPSIALYVLLYYCRSKGIQLIADSTEWYTKPEGNWIYRSYISLDMYLRMKVVQPKLSGVISISKFIYDYYDGKLPVILVPPLIDKCDKKWLESKHGINVNALSNEKFVFKLVYAGSQGKGIKDRFDIIINAVCRIAEANGIVINIAIMGITETDYCNLFGENALPNNYGQFVSFYGRVPHIDALRRITESHFMIFIRDRIQRNQAGFPTKLVEAIACGTPVITNNTSNISDYIVNGENGFIIDDTTELILERELLKILSLDRDTILAIKQSTSENNLFDFRNYVELFRQFLFTNIKA